MFSITRQSILTRSIKPLPLSNSLSASCCPRPASLSSVSWSNLKLPTVSAPPRLPISLSFQHVSAFSVSTRDLNSTAALRARADLDEPPPVPSPESSDEPASRPFSSIESYVSPPLYRAITQAPFGYSHMSPVQEQLLTDLPNLIQLTEDGETKTKDLLVKAKTGTGKTLAFLIPAIESRLRDLAAEEARFKAHNPEASHQHFVQHMRRYESETTGIVIMSPTRELATQIAQEAVKLTSHLKQFGIRLFVGGASKALQLREWGRGRRDIVVATPGRLNDVLNTSDSVRQNLSTTKTLIMDEADTLLEMGFKEEIDEIVQQLPPKEERSTYLFSATISPEIRTIAQETMKRDTKIIDCVPTGESNVHAHVPQFYTILPSADKQVKHLFNLLAHDQMTNPNGKTVIFLPTTKMTQLFSHLIMNFRRYLPWNSASLTKVYEMHGGRSQKERENIAKDFRAGAGGGYQILVTSDVSARGVDYPGVTRVIQIGVPTTRDIYVHRVGRTGRAGKSGRGDLVLLPFEAGYIPNTLRDLPIKPLPVSNLNEELLQLASKVDESGDPPVIKQQAQSRSMLNNRNSRFPQKVSSSSTEVRMNLPVVERLNKFDENLKENILPSIGEESIRESFGSLLGYYTSKSADIRATKESMLHGLKQWSVEGMLLSEEPYVSPAFLQKLGFNNERSFSRFTGSRNQRGGGNWGRGGSGNAWGRGGGGRDGVQNRGRGGGGYGGREGGGNWGRSGGGGGGGGMNNWDRGSSNSGGYFEGRGGSRGRDNDRFGSHRNSRSDSFS